MLLTDDPHVLPCSERAVYRSLRYLTRFQPVPTEVSLDVRDLAEYHDMDVVLVAFGSECSYGSRFNWPPLVDCTIICEPTVHYAKRIPHSYDTMTLLVSVFASLIVQSIIGGTTGPSLSL